MYCKAKALPALPLPTALQSTHEENSRKQRMYSDCTHRVMLINFEVWCLWVYKGNEHLKSTQDFPCKWLLKCLNSIVNLRVSSTIHHLHKEGYQCVNCNKWFGRKGASGALQSTYEFTIVATWGLYNHLNENNMERQACIWCVSVCVQCFLHTLSE